MFMAMVGFGAAVGVSIAFPAAWAKIVVGGRAIANAVLPLVKRIKVAIEEA